MGMRLQGGEGSSEGMSCSALGVVAFSSHKCNTTPLSSSLLTAHALHTGSRSDTSGTVCGP